MNANSQANNAAEAKSSSTESSGKSTMNIRTTKKRPTCKCAADGISDLMKSKKSDQLTKQF
jgi:hypothetical protein